jgi:hypothetical protein
VEPNSSRIYFDPPVTDAQAMAGEKGATTKQALQKIAQLVPVEIVGGYEAAVLFVGAVKPASLQIWIYWLLFWLGLLGTLWYVGWQIGKRFKKQRHLIVYAAAYVVWVYAISGERLLRAPYYQDAIAAIVLIVASAVFAKIPLPAKAT